MRFITPKIDTKRKHKWFALFPVTIGRETRWLETVEVEQKYTEIISPCGDEPERGWYNLNFTNK